MYDRKIKVTDIPAKIKFVEERLELFRKWEASIKLKQVKERGIAALREQISFLQDARQSVLTLKKRG